MTEVEREYLGVSFGLMGGNIVDLVGGFVVDDLELEVGVVASCWGCLNGRLYFL